ncbi:uncharacterized protein H6S33_007795 [Morchella sextelata]|uniref:uncharacterized protein n=1 Tax=Morchella sextelata TaxID=1174677 RepID=UPI001D04497F|nr:uncharacterized protein H6S33_007795 [Morchella sextelata]KAH0603473.1 hypothetical protein H6S33_007795 [Morchella sextelata]
MDRIRKWFSQRETQAYTALPSDPDASTLTPADTDDSLPGPVSKFQYFVFCLLGCAMLWSWNMFMACATYFQRRFDGSDFLLTNFQSLILVFSTMTNLIGSYWLSKRQATADYPRRIWLSLVFNCGLTAVLAASTVMWVVGPASYIVVVLLCVVVAAWSTALSQNGVFAFVNTFGGVYMQAVMTGQAIAGVLPAIAQIVTVVLVPTNDSQAASPKSAFLYFLTATFISALSLLLFFALLARHSDTPAKLPTDTPATAPLEAPTPPHRKEVGLWTLFKKLRYLATALWLTFFVTMAFPVYTQVIVSVRPLTPDTPRLFTPDVFIPLSFLIWNLGDLSGRILCGVYQWRGRAEGLALLALARIVFVPALAACNVRGEGALVDSDLWYWLVQFAFGVSSGWIGSCAMIRAPEVVEKEEREAVGGFMGLCLVVGLAAGSAASFWLGA